MILMMMRGGVPCCVLKLRAVCCVLRAACCVLRDACNRAHTHTHTHTHTRIERSRADMREVPTTADQAEADGAPEEKSHKGKTRKEVNKPEKHRVNFSGS